MTSLKAYASDLSDQEWAILEPLIPSAKPGGRPRSVDMRQILNGIFYMLRSGCAWRLLPHDYPAWSTVYDYFRKWRNAGVWEQIVTTLRERLRLQAGRKRPPAQPSLIANRSKPRSEAEPMAIMGERNCLDANGTCSSTRWDCCSRWSFTRPISRIARASRCS